MNDQNFIASLLKPTTNKSSSRKVWSIDLETVWLPFFTATNATGGTAIPHEALGCPLRLAYNKDNSVKFSNTGKPVIQVAKEVNSAVRMVRENFIAGLQAHAHDVYTNHADLYKAEVAENIKAGSPISERDGSKLSQALAELKRQAEAQAEAEAQAVADRQTVAEALNHADQQAEAVPA